MRKLLYLTIDIDGFTEFAVTNLICELTAQLEPSEAHPEGRLLKVTDDLVSDADFDDMYGGEV